MRDPLLELPLEAVLEFLYELIAPMGERPDLGELCLSCESLSSILLNAIFLMIVLGSILIDFFLPSFFPG